MSDIKIKTSSLPVEQGNVREGSAQAALSLRAPEPRLYKYPQKMRLRKRPEYLATQRRGQRVHGAHIIVIAARTRRNKLRLGITASKKVGNAVERNLVKRRLREIFRQQVPEIKQSADLVVIARHSALEAPFSDLREDFVRSLKRALDLMKKSKKGQKRSASLY